MSKNKRNTVPGKILHMKLKTLDKGEVLYMGHERVRVETDNKDRVVYKVDENGREILAPANKYRKRYKEVKTYLVAFEHPKLHKGVDPYFVDGIFMTRGEMLKIYSKKAVQTMLNEFRRSS